MAQPSDYFLDDDQLRILFEDVVVPAVFDGYTPQAQPVLSLFGGQQGADKSQAIAARRQEADGGDLIASSFFPIYQDLPGLPMAFRVSGRLTVLPTS
ncbi:hypothetical protein [Streptomyces sp. NPDC093093]|uniref:hypothetical protein n=1 Tax=Streptomyces sp. NPDC093093 TaxID=3366025 RepID=UPI00382D1A2E